MKKIYICIVMLAAVLLGTSCNDEWTDELYQQYISFKAPIGANGVTDIYVRYKENGKVTYKLPIIVSGNTDNVANREVHIAVDSDTLKVLNDARFGREDLYFKELQKSSYSFPEVVNIPKGVNTVTADIDFSLGGIDLVNKWVLPLTIVDSPSYNYDKNPRKNFAKALLRVLPFNDYSGNYSTTTMQVFIKKADGTYDIKDAMVKSNRTAYVVDDNRVFFYAGLVEEDLIDRAAYKVYFEFGTGNDKSLKLYADNEKIKFKPSKEAFFYSITEKMDDEKPYLLHRYVTFDIEYDFVDYTSAPGVEIPYKVKGSLTLERRINTQIPDEDQAIEW